MLISISFLYLPIHFINYEIALFSIASVIEKSLHVDHVAAFVIGHLLLKFWLNTTFCVLYYHFYGLVKSTLDFRIMLFLKRYPLIVPQLLFLSLLSE